jgi:hypothetical protein
MYYLKKKTLMKKMMYVAVALIALSFASCGNRKAAAEAAQQDSIRLADSLAAVAQEEATAAREAAAAAALAADTTALDTVTVAK